MEKYIKLHHEDLDAYQVAIEFLALVAMVLDRFPCGYGSMDRQKMILAFPQGHAQACAKRLALHWSQSTRSGRPW